MEYTWNGALIGSPSGVWPTTVPKVSRVCPLGVAVKAKKD